MSCPNPSLLGEEIPRKLDLSWFNFCNISYWRWESDNGLRTGVEKRDDVSSLCPTKAYFFWWNLEWVKLEIIERSHNSMQIITIPSSIVNSSNSCFSIIWLFHKVLYVLPCLPIYQYPSAKTTIWIPCLSGLPLSPVSIDAYCISNTKSRLISRWKRRLSFSFVCLLVCPQWEENPLRSLLSP